MRGRGPKGVKNYKTTQLVGSLKPKNKKISQVNLKILSFQPQGLISKRRHGRLAGQLCSPSL